MGGGSGVVGGGVVVVVVVRWGGGGGGGGSDPSHLWSIGELETESLFPCDRFERFGVLELKVGGESIE